MSAALLTDEASSFPPGEAAKRYSSAIAEGLFAVKMAHV